MQNLRVESGRKKMSELFQWLAERLEERNVGTGIREARRFVDLYVASCLFILRV